MTQIVIAGGGQAGFQTAMSLRQNGFDGRILLVGDEPGLPYQRPPLSKAYLTGDMSREGLDLRPATFFTKEQIELIADCVDSVDRQARRVTLRAGGTLAYDHLVLATGARNRLLNIEGADSAGVHLLRTAADAERLRAALAGAQRAVVIGAGFIGLEIAAGLRKRGIDVTVLEALDRVMARAVTPELSVYFARYHAEDGTRLLFKTGAVRLTQSGGHVDGVVTSDGSVLPADLVVIGVGVVPNVELAAAAGLPVDNGIVVDKHLLTADPHISAIGDCAAFPSIDAGRRVRLESVQNAVDQARCVAARLTGRPHAYGAVPWFWSDQGTLKLQMVGLTQGWTDTVVIGDPAAASFSVLCFAGSRLIGIESVNRPADHMAGRRLLAGATSLTPEMARAPGFDLKAFAKQALEQTSAV